MIPAVELKSWPDPDSCTHAYDRSQSGDSHRYSRTPDGVFPGVTTVLKVLGLSKEGLIKWATNLEREAVLDQANEIYKRNRDRGPGEIFDGDCFRGQVEAELVGSRAHQRALEKAGDIGTQVHNRIRWFLARECGVDRGPAPPMNDAASRAYVSFTDWWSEAGLKPIRVEQPLWDPMTGYAGTCDLIADTGTTLEVWDFKSGKGIYLEYHLQLMAYVHAARRWAPISGGGIVRLPKTEGEVFDPQRDIERLGERKYDGRTFSEAQLLAAFTAALTAWSILCANPEFKP